MTQQVCVKFEEELIKNPELKITDIKELKKWCKDQSHVPDIVDHELALFLHSNYYLMEPTKLNIETYYTLKTQLPEFFSQRDPLGNRDLRQAFQVMTFTPMKKTTKEGYKVMVGRLIDSDARKFILKDILKVLCMNLDGLLHLEGTTEGYLFLFDMANFSIGHASRINPLLVKNFLTYLQDGIPLRLKGLHFINTNFVMNIVLSIIKPFMKKELIDMLYLHPNLEAAEKFVPLDIVPNQLGGSAGHLIEFHDAQIKKLEDLRDWFLEEETRARVDGSKCAEQRKWF